MMLHTFFNVEKSTFLVYAFKRGREEVVAKKSTLCTLVKMSKIVNGPLVHGEGVQEYILLPVIYLPLHELQLSESRLFQN